MRFPGTNGVAARVFGWHCVAATHCCIWGPQQDRLIRVATEYAYEYNDELLPQLLALEQQHLEHLETMLSDHPSRARVFEAAWERATRRVEDFYRQIKKLKPRYGAPWSRRELECWKLFLIRWEAAPR